MSHAPRRGRRRGRVESYDEAAGHGVVREQGAEDGDEPCRWFFHCTAIADGSRAIDTGTDVEFELRPAHRGRWEACDLRPA